MIYLAFAVVLILLPILFGFNPFHKHEWRIVSYDISEPYRNTFSVSCVTQCDACNQRVYHAHKSVEYPALYGLHSRQACEVWLRSLASDNTPSCLPEELVED